MTSGRGHEDAISEAMEQFARAGETESLICRAAGTTGTLLPLVQLGASLPGLPKKVVEKIEADEFIDFGEVPPARGKGRPFGHAFKRQVMLVQAADFVQTPRLIPELSTWTQCFSLLTAVVARKRLEKVPELMAYLGIIAKASQKYKWPAWIIYDQKF